MFFGDPHGDFEPVIAAVERFHPEAIVLLGDLQPRQPLHIELQPILDRTEVWFIHGNHDTDSDADYDHLWGSELADRNLHGRIVSIAGYRVAGLGGVFRSKIWDPRRPIEEAAFVSSDDHAPIHAPRRSGGAMALPGATGPPSSRTTTSSCSGCQSADILVTHEAPAAHPHGWQAIDELAKMLGARLLVHGHHHENIDYVGQGLMDASAPFRAFGVDKGSHLSWPLDERGPA